MPIRTASRLFIPRTRPGTPRQYQLGKSATLQWWPRPSPARPMLTIDTAMTTTIATGIASVSVTMVAVHTGERRNATTVTTAPITSITPDTSWPSTGVGSTPTEVEIHGIHTHISRWPSVGSRSSSALLRCHTTVSHQSPTSTGSFHSSDRGLNRFVGKSAMKASTPAPSASASCARARLACRSRHARIRSGTVYHRPHSGQRFCDSPVRS